MVGILVGVICLAPDQYEAPISFPFASLAIDLPVHCLDGASDWVYSEACSIPSQMSSAHHHPYKPQVS